MIWENAFYLTFEMECHASTPSIADKAILEKGPSNNFMLPHQNFRYFKFTSYFIFLSMWFKSKCLFHLRHRNLVRILLQRARGSSLILSHHQESICCWSVKLDSIRGRWGYSCGAEHVFNMWRSLLSSSGPHSKSRGVSEAIG